MTTVDFAATSVDPSAPEALALVGAMEDEIEALYADRAGSIHSVGAGPQVMGPPGGAFIVLRADDRAVAAGGLKRIGAEVCEIKRMYVVPDARGCGLARGLLEALEGRARELGYEIARLDTGDRQPAAKHLYESAGYRSIPDYNGNTMASYWFEKEL